METRVSKQFVNDIYAYRCAIESTPIPAPENVKGGPELAEIVELLLKYGTDPAEQNFNGDTPLQYAIKVRNPTLTYVLLWAFGGEVRFTMDSIGDQHFLGIILKELTADS